MVLATYSAGNPRADRIAEWVAGEQRADQHPDARVIYDWDADVFAVVTDDTPAS